MNEAELNGVTFGAIHMRLLRSHANKTNANNGFRLKMCKKSDTDNREKWYQYALKARKGNERNETLGASPE